MQSPKFQQFAHSYDKATPIQSDVALFFARLLSTYIEKNNNQTWLDMGCGTGKLSLAILEKFVPNQIFNHLYGLDNSQNMLNIWQNHCQNFPKNPTITFHPIWADMTQLPFDNHFFDVVISSFAVHWVNPTYINEFCRVIKQGGQLHLAIPVIGSLRQVKERFPLLPIYDFLPTDDWLIVIQNFTQQISGKILYQIEQNFSYSYVNLAALLKDLKQMGGTFQAKNRLTTQQLRHYLQDNQTIDLNYQVLLIGIKV